ncbi:hypothetical protein LR48_Vigan11g065600 [Vigna angularis]|uniref:Uncharacterized protein n=1 Tax=Phaseolus angularis TaxID=3914 RepID=A0A0L9VRQ0_PHAAN|nr:hypothetical protein LR48_Vigan11g065600 [Vigna angularis]
MREEELERRPTRVSAVSRGACDAWGRYSRWPVFAGGPEINARPGTLSLFRMLVNVRSATSGTDHLVTISQTKARYSAPFPMFVRHLSNERSSFSLISQRPFIHLLDGPFGYHLPNERSLFSILSQRPFGNLWDGPFGDHLPNERSLFGSFPNVCSSSLQRALVIQPPFPTSVHPPLGRTVWLPSPQRALVIQHPFPTSVRPPLGRTIW